MLTMIYRFRWAACQLDTLTECVSRGMIFDALKDLPKTLDETYDRIVRKIDERRTATAARQILTWLTYAEHPLTATEVLQVTGLVIDNGHYFDEEKVLEDVNDILRICSSLVSITTTTSSSDGTSVNEHTADDSFHHTMDSDSNVPYVRLAHFSVKEYLLSNRPCISIYRLAEEESHDVLAKCCLVYLLRFHEDEWRSPNCEAIFPLARYASRYWTRHARASVTPSEGQKDLSIELFTRNSTAYSAWMRFFDVGQPWERAPDIQREVYEMPDPLYVASHEGLAYAASGILDAGADVNAQKDRFGSALFTASARGYEQVVQILIDAGADINAQGGDFDRLRQSSHCLMLGVLSVLRYTFSRGHTNVMEELAECGGDEKLREALYKSIAKCQGHGEQFGDALYAASAGGYENVVQILKEAGADVNAQKGGYHNALYAGSARGHAKVVQMLLDAGADVNAQKEDVDTVLQAASEGGHEKVVQLLLEAGADVNAHNEGRDTALQAASRRGHEKVVQLLKDAGAV